jgi:hypothetical protein
LATSATARPIAPTRALDPSEFHPIVLPPGAGGVNGSGQAALPAAPIHRSAHRLGNETTIADFEGPDAFVGGRATPRQRASVGTILKEPPFRATGHRVNGPATWYCRAGISVCHSDYPGGLYAAAGPRLRVGDWRGRRVQVCAGGDCVIVRLVDWCACGGGRVIDLYSDAFRRLAPLGEGEIRVTVRW